MRAGLAGGALRGAAALLLVAASAGCSLLSLDILPDGEGGGAPTTSSSGGGEATTSSAGGGGTGGAGVGGGSGPGGGGAGGEGGGEVGPCGKFDMLRDDFESQASTQRYFGLGQAKVQGGALVAEHATVGASTQYIAAYSLHTYDLRDSAVAVRAVEVTNATTGYVETFFRVALGNSYVHIAKVGTQLRFARDTAGDYQQIGAITYDPVLHAHWRMRESAGTFYFETSPDGTGWTVRAQTASSALLPLELLNLELGSYYETPGANPGRARFDELRGDTATAGPACKLTTLQDDFDRSSEATLWRRSSDDPGCKHAYVDGRLQFDFTDGESGYCFLRSSRLYDLSASAISLRAVEVTAPGKTAETYVELRAVGGDAVLVVGNGNLLILGRKPAGGSTEQIFSTAYLPSEFAYWRLRESNGSVLLETSANGTSFTERAQTQLDFDPSRVEVILGAGTWNDPIDVGKVRLDDLNILP